MRKVGLLAAFLLFVLARQALASRLPLYGVPADPPTAVSVNRDSLLIQMGWTILGDERERFARVPEFTLYADGTVIFLHKDSGRGEVLAAHLSRTEADSVRRHVLALGLDRLESHTGCYEQLPGNIIRTTDSASYSVIRVRMGSDSLRVIKNCADFANDRVALEQVRTFLLKWHVSGAQRYIPRQATLVVMQRCRPRPAARRRPSWPLTPEFLISERPPERARWCLGDGERIDRALVIGKKQYDALLKAGTLSHLGGMHFIHEEWNYDIVVRPWLPGEDFTSDVQSYRPYE